MADIRPKLHYTPVKGWINDPNGLIYADGKFHLFCQFYPDDTKWGPMHWGHAISDDLLKWEHLPVAIIPTEEEYAFSGSAVLDYKNVSGLGDGVKPAMILFYTAHNPLTGEQQQCIAYSSDYKNFTRYEGNPVIKNAKTDADFKPDFRDPKVIVNTVIGGFTMVLAAGHSIEFYHSKDLLNWHKTGEFAPGILAVDGICECPDLIKFELEDSDKYVLTMSMVMPSADGEDDGHVMQYFVGKFDGNTFTADNYDERQVLDFGNNNYAAVTFAETSAPIMMGWAEDWNEARVNTNTEYFGKMTCARKLDLAQARDTYFIKQMPIFGCDDSDSEVSIQRVELSEGEKFVIGNACIVNNHDSISINGNVIPRILSGDTNLTVVMDHGFYEIFADNGLITYSKNL